MNVSDAETLKQLETRAAKLEAERDALADELAQTQDRLFEANTRRTAVLNQIDQILRRNQNPVVTEHAILRYLERANGVDREEIVAAILSPKTIEQIRTLGSGKYPIGNGLKAVVKGNTVVSIID